MVAFWCRRFVVPSLACLLVVACSDGGGRDLGLTTERTLVPRMTRATPAREESPAQPELRDGLLAEGLGAFDEGPGEPLLPRALEGDPPADATEEGTLLSRFVHLADAQLLDDESPVRLTLFDAPGLSSAAFRPQEHFGCHFVDAMARTLRRIHRRRPIDFILLGGDNIDNAQSNELEWFLRLAEGGEVECDSGDDDDIVPGRDNDPKDPIDAVGFPVPFYWVQGNHDSLVQGNVVVTEERDARARSDTAIGWARDWTQPGGPLSPQTVADARRTLLTPAALLARVQAHGDGHGLDDEAVARGRAHYAVPLPGDRLTLIVVDTAAPTGAASGLLRRPELTEIIAPMFDAARERGHWVIVTSHHAAASLTDGGGVGGMAQDDAVLEEEWTDFLSEQPHLLMSLVAHSHRHRIRELEGAGGRFFEVMTASLLDYPQQARMLEVRELGDGRVAIDCIGVDYVGGAIAEEGRALAILDYTSGWSDDGTSERMDRNVRLIVPRPAF